MTASKELTAAASLAGVPSLPSLLATIVADPEVAGYGEHGFETKPGRWLPPAVISPDVQEAAGRALAERRTLYETKATARQAIEWVVSLGLLTAGRASSAEDVKLKAGAYASMMVEYPAAVLNRDTLRRAADAFKFFPSYAEVAERLDIEAGRLRREQTKLKKLAAGNAPAPSRTESAVRSAVRPMPGTKAEKKPEREPILTQPPSAEQLAEWAKAAG